ncbi:hypothetical protein [Demequina litorisediminis]|uniref:hypothetical protein n=1 Tax=Demequina litorisediminis TaxID=1849022 RepID=UPI003D66642C
MPAWTLGGVIRLYQATISPLTGPTCKYYPSLFTLRTHRSAPPRCAARWNFGSVAGAAMQPLE